MNSLSRRSLLGAGIVGVGGLSLAGLGWRYRSDRKGSETRKTKQEKAPNGFVHPESIAVANRPLELTYLAPYANRAAKWNSGELFTFINQLEDPHLNTLGKSFELEGFVGRSKPLRVQDIHKELLWQSSHVFTYPFKSLESIDYHALVVWCAGEVGIASGEAKFTNTFDLEQQIVKRQFVDVWDKLTPQQRQELLSKIDSDKTLTNASAIASMSGVAALIALSSTVYFQGFAFYTTMSVVICTVAGWMGVTLPFAAYMTASSTVAFLSGPIGWAICATLLAGAIVTWVGAANVRKTTAAIMQIHALKAGALYGVGQKT